MIFILVVRGLAFVNPKIPWCRPNVERERHGIIVLHVHSKGEKCPWKMKVQGPHTNGATNCDTHWDSGETWLWTQCQAGWMENECVRPSVTQGYKDLGCSLPEMSIDRFWSFTCTLDLQTGCPSRQAGCVCNHPVGAGVKSACSPTQIFHWLQMPKVVLAKYLQ